MDDELLQKYQGRIKRLRLMDDDFNEDRLSG